MENKYICLDIGNVLIKLDFSKFLEDLSYEVNITKNDANDFLYRIQKDHDIGLIDFKRELTYLFNIKSEVKLEKLLKSWDTTLVYSYMDFITPLNYLLDNNYKIGLLSNIGFEHKQLVNNYIKNINNYIDKNNNIIRHYSCDVGARKPTKLYFQSFLIENPDFKNCLYFDDIEENVEGGIRAGFKGKIFNLQTTDKSLIDIIKES